MDFRLQARAQLEVARVYLAHQDMRGAFRALESARTLIERVSAVTQKQELIETFDEMQSRLETAEGEKSH